MESTPVFDRFEAHFHNRCCLQGEGIRRMQAASPAPVCALCAGPHGPG